MMFSRDSVVLRFRRNAKSTSLRDIKRSAIIEKKKHLLDLNRQQLRVGIDSKGRTFGDYNENYADFKQDLNSYYASPPTPDLYLSGELQSKMGLKIIFNDVIVSSADPKAEKKITEKYIDAFGFNENIMPQSILMVTTIFIRNTYKALFRA